MSQKKEQNAQAAPSAETAQAAQPAQGQQVRVALNSAHMRTSYANVFQTRRTAEEVVICFGLSLPESLNGADGAKENILSVELDRRIIMTPESARRLLHALNSVLNGESV